MNHLSFFPGAEMIRKATISIRILFDDQEMDPIFSNTASLENIERAMNDFCLGSTAIELIEPVRTKDMKKELLDIGSDGTLFAEAH